MIELSQFAVWVTSEYELNTVLQFYRLATGLPILTEYRYYQPTHVGVWVNLWAINQNAISIGSLADRETSVSFQNIAILADTDERKTFLEQAKLFAQRGIKIKNLDGEI